MTRLEDIRHLLHIHDYNGHLDLLNLDARGMWTSALLVVEIMEDLYRLVWTGIITQASMEDMVWHPNYNLTFGINLEQLVSFNNWCHIYWSLYIFRHKHKWYIYVQWYLDYIICWSINYKLVSRYLLLKSSAYYFIQLLIDHLHTYYILNYAYVQGSKWILENLFL